MTEYPTHATSAKKAMTSASATRRNATRAFGGIIATTSGQPMWARLAAASAEP